MAGTTHRKDVGFDDFRILHRFRRAWQTLTCDGVRYLGERHILIPTWWQVSPGRYTLRGLKGYYREVYFVPIRDFRRLCRYAGLEPGKVLSVLFRFSMIATLECESEWRFRVQFSSDGGNPWQVPQGPAGYLIEKRRLVEKFTRMANGTAVTALHDRRT